MMTPTPEQELEAHQLLTALLSHGLSLVYAEHDNDSAAISVEQSIARILAYGDARAAAERERCIQAAREVVAHILATTAVPDPGAPGYDGGKRVGARDVLSALLNLD